MKDILSEIVDRAIRKVLSEGNLSGMNYLYHFTTIPSVVSIMSSGSLYLSGNENYRNGDFYFCSLTRSKMGNEGYSIHLPVRITFNADILRSINGVRINPFNYFVSGLFYGVDEREERLLSPNRVINVEDAIERIDVYISDRFTDSDIYDAFKDVIGKYMMKTHFYKEKTSFDSVNDSSSIDWHYIVMGAKYEGKLSNYIVDNYRVMNIRNKIGKYKERNKYFKKDVYGKDGSFDDREDNNRRD